MIVVTNHSDNQLQGNICVSIVKFVLSGGRPLIIHHLIAPPPSIRHPCCGRSVGEIEVFLANSRRMPVPGGRNVWSDTSRPPSRTLVPSHHSGHTKVPPFPPPFHGRYNSNKYANKPYSPSPGRCNSNLIRKKDPIKRFDVEVIFSGGHTQLKLCRHQCVWKWEKFGTRWSWTTTKISWVPFLFSVSNSLATSAPCCNKNLFSEKVTTNIILGLVFCWCISCKEFRNRKCWPKLISLGSFSCEVSAVHTWWDRG